MNNAQKKAIRDAETALQKLSDVGLSLAGIDYDLVVFRHREYEKASKKKRSWAPVGPTEVINELDYYSFENIPYVDSGGT